MRKNSLYCALIFVLVLTSMFTLEQKAFGKETLSLQWQNSIKGLERVEYIQQTSDGGYVVLGGMEVRGDSFAYPYLLKLDKARNLKWKTKLFTAFGTKVLDTSDKGFIVLGQNENQSTYVTKLSSSGKIQWHKDIDVESEYPNIIVTKDKGYLISLGYGEDIISLDASGKKKWKKKISDVNSIHSVLETSDKGFILTGGSPVGIYLLKLSKSGKQEWRKNYTGKIKFLLDDSDNSSVRVSMDYGSEVIQTKDGGYLIGGSKYSTGHNLDVFLLKTDKKGQKQWEKTFNRGEADRLGSLIQTAEGGYLFSASRADWESTGFPYIIKTDKMGNKTWEKNYSSSGNVSNVQQAKDKGYLAGVNVEDDQGVKGSLIKYIVKTVKP